jgi:hypothetical protein
MEINVVGICGLYRTGKSYLMNWIADEKTGRINELIHSWLLMKNSTTRMQQLKR